MTTSLLFTPSASTLSSGSADMATVLSYVAASLGRAALGAWAMFDWIRFRRTPSSMTSASHDAVMKVVELMLGDAGADSAIADAHRPTDDVRPFKGHNHG